MADRVHPGNVGRGWETSPFLNLEPSGTRAGSDSFPSWINILDVSLRGGLGVALWVLSCKHTCCT